MKRIVFALVVIVLLAGLFAPVVQRAALSLAAEKPAAAQFAYEYTAGRVVYPAPIDPANPFSTKPGSGVQPCVGWNS